MKSRVEMSFLGNYDQSTDLALRRFDSPNPGGRDGRKPQTARFRHSLPKRYTP